MNFIYRALGMNKGYAPLPSRPEGMLDEASLQELSPQEYAKLKERTIRIIAAIPARYLSAEKGQAAIEALRAGRYFFFSVGYAFFSLGDPMATV